MNSSFTSGIGVCIDMLEPGAVRLGLADRPHLHADACIDTGADLLIGMRMRVYRHVYIHVHKHVHRHAQARRRPNRSG